jgi:hypothetical protein
MEIVEVSDASYSRFYKVWFLALIDSSGRFLEMPYYYFSHDWVAQSFYKYMKEVRMHFSMPYSTNHWYLGDIFSLSIKIQHKLIGDFRLIVY